MSEYVERALDALREHGCTPRREGEQWAARCPAHDDRKPSLGIREGRDGRALLLCRAGCDYDDVRTQLGLAPADLGPLNGNGRHEPEATYPYVAEDGTLLFEVVRRAGKRFTQRRPDGRGGWVWKLGNTRRVLYRLPQVGEAAEAGETVYVVEGEKDVHALEAVGAVATCNPGGAGKWRDEYSPSLRGAQVVVVADRDDAGRAHAERVRSSLAAADVPVQVLEPAAGKDAADHLAAGLGLGDFVPIEPPADDTARELAELWALPAGVSIRRARITERGQAASAASVDVELSNGETIHFERQSDMVRPSTVALEVAARTGAVPALKTADALRAVGHLRALAAREVAFDADQLAEGWGVAYLQSAPTRHVDMGEQAERWRAFCDLERMDPVGRRPEGLTIPQASLVLVGEADGTRYVRTGWFRAYVRGEDQSLSPQEVAHRMRRVGWDQRGTRGKRGRIKATRPGGGTPLAWSFYEVPKGWGE